MFGITVSMSEPKLLQNHGGSRNIQQEQERAPEVHCSRERSRAAWKVIEEYLTPFVEKENYQLSTKCRLHHENDMFRDQEEHKIYLDRNEWQCGYCKKSFRDEKFIDQHLDNRHHNLLDLALLFSMSNLDMTPIGFHFCCIKMLFYTLKGHGKCLADLCGALHCDAVMNSKSSRSKCNPAAAARNRHLCESLADGCFPISDGPSASRLHELFLHQFCDAHTCSGKHKPFSRGGKDQGSFFRLAAGALILVLLPVFYLFLYLIQSDMKGRNQELRRISKSGWKAKPS
ncbi:nucleic acid binding protein [Trifolium pratense]|uniref:Nucleic acid binding protein n=1 Tax=Trifolium pratense TaxID=57577 RepID=A0A2K3PP72_TRIPR|nr:nucleic acid binding protein [Trifolium pratense]